MEKNEFSIYGLCLKGTTELRYVGYTYKNLQKRLTEHRYEKGANNEKIKWIRENSDNIEIIAIQIGIKTLSEAHKQEKHWIKFYRENGHNLLNKTDGGEGTNGYKHSKESIQKTVNHPNHPKNNPQAVRKIISHPNHSKNNKEVIKKIISHQNHPANNPEMMTALHNHPNSSKNNPNTIKKILSHPNHPKNNRNATLKMLRHPNVIARNKRFSKSVVQFNLNGKIIQIFDSISDAARFLGDVKHGSLIGNAANGKSLTAVGFKWKFYNTGMDLRIVLTEKNDETIKIGQKPPSHRRRLIIQCDLFGRPIQRFNSITEAMKFLHIGSISNCLSGKEKTAYGFKWIYAK